MAGKLSGPADKNRNTSNDADLQGQSTSGDFPDFNTPLNAAKAGPEPGPDVLDPVNPWDTGGEPPDPNGYINLSKEGGRNRKR